MDFTGHLQENNKSEKDFRLSARKLILTYSQTEISREDCLSQLKVILNNKIKNYVISQENHLDSGKHLHVYLELKSKINIINPTKLDLIECPEKVIHGNYQTVNSTFDSLEYVKKIDKNYLSSLEDDFNIRLKEIAEESGLHAAMDYFVKMKPEKVVTNYSSYFSNLKKFCQSKESGPQMKYPIESFEYPPEVNYWFENERNKLTLALIGETGYGKTQGIITLLREKGYVPLKINDLNSLKDYIPGVHTALIMDDICWKEIDRETKIQLFEKDLSGHIKILYNAIKLDSKMIKIVLANFKDDLLDIDSMFEDRTEKSGALERRLRIIELKKSLIKPIF